MSTASCALGDVIPGRAVQVLRVDVDAATRLRLAQFGVRPGVTIAVLSRTSGGGRLLGLGSSRIALDRATVARLYVADRAAA